MNQQPQELLRHENYLFRMMTPNDRQQALNLLVDEFYDQEPLSIAYYNNFPQLKPNARNELRKFQSLFINACIDSKMSVVIVDLNTSQIIGVSLAKDLNLNLPNFQQQFMCNLNLFAFNFSLYKEIIKHIKFYPQDFFTQVGKITEIFQVALKKKHMGKKLLHKMITANQKLSLREGFQYSFVFASNFKTGIAMMKQNYEKLAEIQNDKFEYQKVKPFQNIEQINSKASIWLKKLI